MVYVYTVRFFSSKCSLFHNSNVFVSCFIHILYTECAKIKKNNNSSAKKLKRNKKTRLLKNLAQSAIRRQDFVSRWKYGFMETTVAVQYHSARVRFSAIFFNVA